MKDDQKNFILFAVIAAIILVGSSLLSNWLFPQNPAPVVAVENGQPKVVPAPQADPTADSPAAIRDRAIVLRETPRIAIETPTLRGSINLKGARIDDLELTRYDETVEKDSQKIRLLSPAGAPGRHFAEFGWEGAGMIAPDSDTVWQASGTKLTPSTPVTLTAANKTGQRFRIEIAVDEDYMFTIRRTVDNFGAAPVSATPRALISRQGRSPDLDQWAAHVGPTVAYGGAQHNINWDEVDEAKAGAPGQLNGLSYATTGGWVGFSDHYWLTALVPAQNVSVNLGLQPGPNQLYQADYRLSAPLNIEPGRGVTYTARFFAGAKEVKLLERYEHEGIVHFDKAIDWGWFGMIEKPIFYYLDWLFRMVGNFGVAIILLTLTIRLLLFPIAQRQFASMASMRALQPKMKALQERYKDDKQRQQQEIMKLYKDEKVNPLAGCLPILLQIPIMFALYKVLLLTIEMRHQEFVGWIRDLSAADPANLVNLAGLYGISLPGFLAIGVIPVLLGVSMYFQIKLNPAPMDEMQKQIFGIMPWVLMFVMAPFAVGLQLYWITSNLLTIAQQWWLYQKHPALKEMPAK